VRDFVHDALLSAAKPTSVEAAEQMLRDIFNDARAECKRLKILGSTTANVSFAVEIDGKNYLIVGNAGDSVCYQENLTAADARSVTKEQLYEPYPNYIFNSIGSHPNLPNYLTNQELKQWEFDPKSIDPETNLPKFSPDPDLLRDQVTHIELKPGMRFVHASDGISGDYIDERLEPSVFGDAMRRGEPAATVRYLINRSIKNDDKSVVAFIVEAA